MEHTFGDPVLFDHVRFNYCSAGFGNCGLSLGDGTMEVRGDCHEGPAALFPQAPLRINC